MKKVNIDYYEVEIKLLINTEDYEGKKELKKELEELSNSIHGDWRGRKITIK